MPEDHSKAFSLWTKSCDLGNYFGCNDLGTLYNKGLGVARDKQRAKELFAYSCEGKLSWGCANLAKLEITLKHASP